MPDFSMTCPHCNSPIENIPEEKEGQIIICMECGKTVQAVSSSAPAPAGRVDQDIILGDKVSDSDMEGFESFETPEEEEEIVEAELIRIRVPWRTSKFMGIVCDVLFLVVAIELALCVYLIYQAQVRKSEDLPQKFAAERKTMQAARKTAMDNLTKTRKSIREQIKADEKEEAVFHTKLLLAETEKIQKVKIPFPEKVDPEKKPYLQENPYLFFLTALKNYTLVEEDIRRSAVMELTQHLKNVLEEIKEQRKYDRVAIIEELIEPFQKGGVDLSEVAIAAKAVIQFEKDEKIRLEQEAKDKVRREKERLAEMERKRQEALEKLANYKDQLVVASSQMYLVEDKFDFTSLRPHAAQNLFAQVCIENSRNADGSLVPVDVLLKHIAKVSNVTLSRKDAEKLCAERFKTIDQAVESKYPGAEERAAAQQKAIELFPEIKRGETVTVVYLDGKSKYSYRGAFARADKNGVIVNGRTFTWKRLDAECRKKLDPTAREQARADYVKSRMAQLEKKQAAERDRLRKIALAELFRSGVVMSGSEVYSTESFIRSIYPMVRELNDARRELENILTEMYPVIRSAKQPAAKAFVTGLQTEFGLKEHTNTGKALQYYESAVKQKSLEAMLRLGDMYSAPRGTTRGIEQNYNRAIQYYTMAAKMNNEYAKTRIRDLEQAMRPAKKVRDKNKKK